MKGDIEMVMSPEASLDFVEPAVVSRLPEAPTFLDVRSPIEFQTEHIEGSINVPINDIDQRVGEIPRGQQLVVVCRSGMRAQRAAVALQNKGFQPKVLKGGLESWKKAGLCLTQGKRMLSIERQIQLIVGVGVLAGVLLSLLVNPWFLILPGFFGAGLTFAGITGTCALGILLDRAPWNKLQIATRENSSSCSNRSGGK
ncbi:MAG: hypothetical protein C0507_21150 [Cyanobacteria bacterium PR.3.49]|nr:hypothetical protein [Cyanobacteria bacterium PR.3.49]